MFKKFLLIVFVVFIKGCLSPHTQAPVEENPRISSGDVRESLNEREEPKIFSFKNIQDVKIVDSTPHDLPPLHLVELIQPQTVPSSIGNQLSEIGDLVMVVGQVNALGFDLKESARRSSPIVRDRKPLSPQNQARYNEARAEIRQYRTDLKQDSRDVIEFIRLNQLDAARGSLDTLEGQSRAVIRDIVRKAKVEKETGNIDGAVFFLKEAKLIEARLNHSRKNLQIATSGRQSFEKVVKVEHKAATAKVPDSYLQRTSIDFDSSSNRIGLYSTVGVGAAILLALAAYLAIDLSLTDTNTTLEVAEASPMQTFEVKGYLLSYAQGQPPAVNMGMPVTLHVEAQMQYVESPINCVEDCILINDK